DFTYVHIKERAMKSKPISLIPVLCAIVLLSTGNRNVTLAQETAPATHSQQPNEDTISRIDTYLSGLTDDGSFSGAVLIARDGEILLSAGYGMANLEWDVPNTPDTRFRIGSLTKQSTAMSILILQDRGSLTVQDPICQYIEDCPTTWEAITIEHLLNHTSGIPEFSRLPGYQQTVTLPTTPAQTIRRFIDEPLNFQPGTIWSYSYSGYVLLGSIIEQVTGQTYNQFLDDNIFEPLGMADTGYDINTAIIGHRAEGYANLNRRASYIDMSLPYAAGGLYSTVEDLYRWNQALYSWEVVSQVSWDAMLAGAVPAPDTPDAFGAYGLFIIPIHGQTTIGNNGEISGFRSNLIHLTTENMDFVILSNLETVNTNRIRNSLVGTFFDEDR